ncbi:hypothetical protein EDEG_03599 [Edhazardia aedis USNM 41457]|uniref:Uncharacterized protein n=1 Tax=Edhazardia aedis (strain USNM 41457) TaxID=1003232 RepID=J9DH54_EDHAE|nr:hypothetical protein EDEG_03599 [Edhazardia aedis USNM 41457]|eukprot:EJW01935.1 hypothetical protein EDEG_03599 [Edhazardia aedis USNM 41457]
MKFFFIKYYTYIFFIIATIKSTGISTDISEEIEKIQEILKNESQKELFDLCIELFEFLKEKKIMFKFSLIVNCTNNDKIEDNWQVADIKYKEDEIPIIQIVIIPKIYYSCVNPSNNNSSFRMFDLKKALDEIAQQSLNSP